MLDFNIDRRAMMARALFLLGAASTGTFTTEVPAKGAAGRKPYLSTPTLELLSAVANGR